MEHLTYHTIILGGLSGVNFMLIAYLLKQMVDVKQVVYEMKGYLKGINERGTGSHKT